MNMLTSNGTIENHTMGSTNKGGEGDGLLRREHEALLFSYIATEGTPGDGVGDGERWIV